MKNICKISFKCKQKLLEQIRKADIISFDIFDTLLLRPFVHPFDVFGYLEYFYELDGYKNARIVAETLARQHYTEKQEITIDNIYEFVPENFQFIKQSEIEFEANILFANSEMLEIFNYAKEQNKIIIITSDMYLPKNMLEQTLKKNGFTGYHKIFISSDIGYRKSDGKLFEYIKKYLPSKNILHIGDNCYSDVKVPRQLGLKAFHYPSVTNSFFQQNNQYQKIYDHANNCIISLVIGLYIIRQHNHKESSYWQYLGYSLGGLFVYAYTKFIVNTLQKEKASDVLFIARDGYVLNKAFELLISTTSIKNHYVYAPRFVRIIGLQQGLNNADYYSFFLHQITSLYPELKNILPSRIDNHELHYILKNNKIIAYCNTIKNEYANYLKTVTLSGSNVYSVDLGSNSASGQKILSYFLNDKIKSGFYWTLNPQANVPHFCYDTSKVPFIFEEIIEFLITAPECPVIGFNNAFPQLKEATEQDKTNIQYIDILSKAEINFVKDINDVLGKFSKQIKAEYVIQYANLFFEYLPKKDIAHFDEIYWFYSPDNRESVRFGDILRNKYSQKYNNCQKGEPIYFRLFNALRHIFHK